jgi:hypothetical protein
MSPSAVGLKLARCVDVSINEATKCETSYDWHCVNTANGDSMRWMFDWEVSLCMQSVAGSKLEIDGSIGRIPVDINGCQSIKQVKSRHSQKQSRDTNK